MEGCTDLGKRIMPILAIYMNERGRDSWGMTDGKFIYKSVGQIIDQFDELDLESPTYHCRSGSVGSISHRNAHPFEFTHEHDGHKKRVVGVHNGHVNNYIGLKNRYQRQHFEVDSEHIFAHLAEDKPISDITGWGTVVWYEQIDDGPVTRYFSTFTGGPLAVVKLKTGEIIFASTDRSLQIAIQMTGAIADKWYKIQADTKYTIENGELRDNGAFKWGVEPPIIRTPSSNTGLPGHYDNRDVCALPDCRTIINVDKELICSWCLHKIKVEYGFEKPRETEASAYGCY